MAANLTIHWLDLQRRGLQRLDAIASRRHPTASHLAIGLQGEREALFHLRSLGYVIVARRWKTVRLRGDVDLIAWDKDCLCFVEIKTRSGRDPLEPAESAVDEHKQQTLRRMARIYLRTFPVHLRDKVRVRFDVVSVYLQPLGPEFELHKGAFSQADRS